MKKGSVGRALHVFLYLGSKSEAQEPFQEHLQADGRCPEGGDAHCLGCGHGSHIHVWRPLHERLRAAGARPRRFVFPPLGVLINLQKLLFYAVVLNGGKAGCKSVIIRMLFGQAGHASMRAEKWDVASMISRNVCPDSPVTHLPRRPDPTAYVHLKELPPSKSPFKNKDSCRTNTCLHAGAS